MISDPSSSPTSTKKTVMNNKTGFAAVAAATTASDMWQQQSTFDFRQIMQFVAIFWGCVCAGPFLFKKKRLATNSVQATLVFLT